MPEIPIVYAVCMKLTRTEAGLGQLQQAAIAGR